MLMLMWLGPHLMVRDPMRDMWVCDGCGRSLTDEWFVRAGLGDLIGSS